MKKLNLILHSRSFFSLLLFVTCGYVFWNLAHFSSKYQNETTFVGTIISKKIGDTYVTYEVNAKEKLLVRYSEDFSLGDQVLIEGTLERPSKNRNFHLFNYQSYLKGKRIFYVVDASKMKLLKKATGLYLFKNQIIKKIENRKVTSYLFAFLLGDSSLLEEKSTYQSLGISHLFAVSGMHVMFFTAFLFFVCNCFFKKEIVSFFVVTVVLGIYIWLLGGSASASRAFLLFVISFCNHYWKWGFSSIQLLIFVFSCLLMLNPFSILQVGFQFSFVICFFLMLQSRQKCGYIKTLFFTSLVASLASFPLSVYHFHQFHFGSILFNLFAVPFVSFLLFPFSFLCFCLPFFDPVLELLISIFHGFIRLCDFFSFLKLSFCSISVVFVFFYYLILIVCFRVHKRWLIVYFICLFLHFWFPYLDTHYWIDMIDVGQGDAILIRYPHLKKVILIDTGGVIPYGNWKSKQAEQILLPYFRALGIHHIDFLILTHGDYDHMGEAIPLIEHFDVKTVIFNCGELNELERELIKVLDRKKIVYYHCMKSLKIGSSKLLFLNDNHYNNENDHSIVLYTEFYHHTFLFMGDASSLVERDLIAKYKLKEIDVLKVSHHGSKTSSSKDFIGAIHPKYSMISVGRNNRYGHPNKEVLKNLESSEIYRTDQDGGIRFQVQKNKLEIKTCLP